MSRANVDNSGLSRDSFDSDEDYVDAIAQRVNDLSDNHNLALSNGITIAENLRSQVIEMDIIVPHGTNQLPESGASYDSVNQQLVAPTGGVKWPDGTTSTSGTSGVSGSGTSGNLAQWTGSAALGNSGYSTDANGRFVLPVGLHFPGGGTLDAPPPSAFLSLPSMDGIASSGASSNYSRGDHVHPSDTSRAPISSPALTGTPTAPTPATADNSTKIATTAFVKANVPSAPVSGRGSVPYNAASATISVPGMTSSSVVQVTRHSKLFNATDFYATPGTGQFVVHTLSANGTSSLDNIDFSYTVFL